MKIILLYIDRLKNVILREYRNMIFTAKTGEKANLIKDIILINTNLKIGSNVTIYPGVMFFGDGLIEIGNNVDIGKDTIIYSSKSGGVKIGNDTMIAAQCYIIDMDHGGRREDLIRLQENESKLIEIGNDVWIAANCTILKGSIISNGAIIGAKSLVKGKIPSYSISVGIPAHEIKQRI